MGSILRFWVGTYVGQRMGTRFPYGTFLINVTGSFLIGFVMTVLTEKTRLSPNWRYLIPIGFIIPMLDQMVDEGLIAISDVEVIKYVHQEGVRSQG
jgi:fructose-specific phosphotransferase system IIC component